MATTSKREHANGTDFQAVIESQLSELRQEIAQLNKALTARGGEMFDDAADRADDTYRAASATAAKAVRHLRGQAHAVSETVKEHPRATTATLAVVGVLALLAGMALARSGSAKGGRW